MSSSGLEWDSLGCPLVSLPSRCKSPFPIDSDNTDLWHCQIHSLWSVSSATGCNTSSRSEGNRRGRLKQEEDEEGRRQWRRAGKEPGGSGRVKEVSQTCSYWGSRHLPPVLLSLNKVHSYTAAALLSSFLICLSSTLLSSLLASLSSIPNCNHCSFFLCYHVKPYLPSVTCLYSAQCSATPFMAEH